MASKSNVETIDTNILLRIVLNDVPPLVEDAIRLLLDDSKTFIIPDIVFCEMVHIMSKILGLDRAHLVEEITETLSAFYNLNYDLHIVTDVFHDYITHPALSFEDCYLAYCATKNSATPLWTFDKKLARELPAAREVE